MQRGAMFGVRVDDAFERHRTGFFLAQTASAVDANTPAGRIAADMVIAPNRAQFIPVDGTGVALDPVSVPAVFVTFSGTDSLLAFSPFETEPLHAFQRGMYQVLQ